MGMETKNIMIVNNTGADISLFYPAIVAAIKSGSALPADIADLFTFSVVTVAGSVRGIIDWA